VGRSLATRNPSGQLCRFQPTVGLSASRNKANDVHIGRVLFESWSHGNGTSDPILARVSWSANKLGTFGTCNLPGNARSGSADSLDRESGDRDIRISTATEQRAERRGRLAFQNYRQARRWTVREISEFERVTAELRYDHWQDSPQPPDVFRRQRAPAAGPECGLERDDPPFELGLTVAPVSELGEHPI
jgi:hypothetical protein